MPTIRTTKRTPRYFMPSHAIKSMASSARSALGTGRRGPSPMSDRMEERSPPTSSRRPRSAGLIVRSAAQSSAAPPRANRSWRAAPATDPRELADALSAGIELAGDIGDRNDLRWMVRIDEEPLVRFAPADEQPATVRGPGGIGELAWD